LGLAQIGFQTGLGVSHPICPCFDKVRLHANLRPISRTAYRGAPSRRPNPGRACRQAPAAAVVRLEVRARGKTARRRGVSRSREGVGAGPVRLAPGASRLKKGYNFAPKLNQQAVIQGRPSSPTVRLYWVACQLAYARFRSRIRTRLRTQWRSQRQRFTRPRYSVWPSFGAAN
jgi:hypothetical protein